MNKGPVRLPRDGFGEAFAAKNMGNFVHQVTKYSKFCTPNSSEHLCLGDSRWGGGADAGADTPDPEES